MLKVKHVEDVERFNLEILKLTEEIDLLKRQLSDLRSQEVELDVALLACELKAMAFEDVNVKAFRNISVNTDHVLETTSRSTSPVRFDENYSRIENGGTFPVSPLFSGDLGLMSIFSSRNEWDCENSDTDIHNTNLLPEALTLNQRSDDPLDLNVDINSELLEKYKSQISKLMEKLKCTKTQLIKSREVCIRLGKIASEQKYPEKDSEEVKLINGENIENYHQYENLTSFHNGQNNISVSNTLKDIQLKHKIKSNSPIPVPNDTLNLTSVLPNRENELPTPVKCEEISGDLTQSCQQNETGKNLVKTVDSSCQTGSKKPKNSKYKNTLDNKSSSTANVTKVPLLKTKNNPWVSSSSTTPIYGNLLNLSKSDPNISTLNVPSRSVSPKIIKLDTAENSELAKSDSKVSVARQKKSNTRAGFPMVPVSKVETVKTTTVRPSTSGNGSKVAVYPERHKVTIFSHGENSNPLERIKARMNRILEKVNQ
jgi:hypothetical protein